MSSSLSELPKPSGLAENHRVRVGREKRVRMRGHLLRSVLAVYSAEPPRNAAFIDDVVQHAEVSRGTFYKYFASLEQAVAELAAQLADEMTASIYAVYDVLGDPAMRTATGFQMFLLRALMDRQWAGFLCRIELVKDDHLIQHHITEDIRLGIGTGDYAVASVEVAADLLMGAKIEAFRRIIADEADIGYIQAMTTMVLRSFGVAPSRADRIVADAYRRLMLEAPGKIDWWQGLA